MVMDKMHARARCVYLSPFTIPRIPNTNLLSLTVAPARPSPANPPKVVHARVVFASAKWNATASSDTVRRSSCSND